MEINVLENKKNRLVFELPGTDHTLCNSLKEELHNVKDVEVATYAIKHPLVGVPKFIVEAKDPKKALLEAAKALKKRNKAFLTAFKKI